MEQKWMQSLLDSGESYNPWVLVLLDRTAQTTFLARELRQRSSRMKGQMVMKAGSEGRGKTQMAVESLVKHWTAFCV